MALILNRKQLCEALGVSDSAIGAWEKKGLPTVRKGRGRGMRSLYDLDAVHRWCEHTGYGQGVQALYARARRPDPGLAPAPAPSAPVHTSGLDEDQRETLVLAPALDVAFLSVPTVLGELGAAPDLVNQALERLIARLARELACRGVDQVLAAELVTRIRGMLEEERANPGSVTE